MVLSTPIAQVIGKRKRPDTAAQRRAIQIITGSYERVLHGFTAIIQAYADPKVEFSDDFLFNAHSTSIRSLAVSPPSSGKRILATGSSDEQINLYQLQTTAFNTNAAKKRKSWTGLTLESEPRSKDSIRHRELGSLTHHTLTVTALSFPSHSKLLSSSLDDTIAITRTRDWTQFATLKAPEHKQHGRPSGYTGDGSLGVNDFAVHPSRRLAISVRQGERCMRLWNLVTGAKAGVLDFDRRTLAKLNGGKKDLGWREGEGRKIVWRDDGQQFAIAFERGVLLFGLDCIVQGYFALDGRKKVGQIRYLPSMSEDNATAEQDLGASDAVDGVTQTRSILALSSEDGRLLFLDALVRADTDVGDANFAASDDQGPRSIALLCELEVPYDGPRTRIKDFMVVPEPAPGDLGAWLHIIAACSDGRVHLLHLQSSDVKCPSIQPVANGMNSNTSGSAEQITNGPVRKVGTLLGTYETGHRITCLTAFTLDGN
ncbi:MAG: hypothetical protein M1828_006736 [Chrysothrix sp. TS-e1954]|nr:MAG: hypothetical protein M1828_006736 [Chrysothrix sp. TS-e1954]